MVLLASLAWLLTRDTDPVLESAATQVGERWYRLLLDDRHLGYLRTETRRDRRGRWRFDSDLRFVLNQGNPVRIEEQLLFDAAPPYPLLQARQQNRRPGELTGTLIRRDGDGYRAWHLNHASGAAPEGGGTPLNFTFGLADHLGFETWLRQSAPAPGATVTARALDFTRRQVVARRFRVAEKNATGYALENPAPLNPTWIQLDDAMRPVAMTLSGLFELEQVDEQQALAPRTALQAVSYFVPTDQPLHDHTRISRLELVVRGGASAGELWPELARGDTLHHQAGAVSVRRLTGDELAETSDHPISHPRVRAMAAEATAGASDGQGRVQALMRFVNGYLRYEEAGARRHVLALLDHPAGDCTEYADLLTTLARSLSIPARTVFGLAYADQRPPAFRFHAWNEVLVDGEWMTVDPTWNQLGVDATHIPMPVNAGHALKLLTGGTQISFLVRNVEYADAGR